MKKNLTQKPNSKLSQSVIKSLEKSFVVCKRNGMVSKFKAKEIVDK